MKPEDISLIRKIVDHSLSLAGDLAVVVVSRIVGNETLTDLWAVSTRADVQSRQLTGGHHDLAPAISPDGATIAFFRRLANATQLCLIDGYGGNLRVVAEHPDGAGIAASSRHPRGISPPTWSPDGTKLAYVAPVKTLPVGTSPNVRRVTRVPYRLDGRGYTIDSYIQVFIVNADARAAPRQLTSSSSDHWDVSWRPDGLAVCMAKRVVVDGRDSCEEIHEVGLDAADRIISASNVTVNLPTYTADGHIVFVGMGPLDFNAGDTRGRNVSLWKVDSRECPGKPIRLTDAEELDFDDNRLRPLTIGAENTVIAARAWRGSVELGELSQVGIWASLIGGKCQVLSYGKSRDLITAVIADDTHAGDLFAYRDGNLSRLTNFSDSYKTVPRKESEEVSARAPDGYPVHGWLLTPRTEGPHPLLVLVHGGPDLQWGYFLNEEAQVYVSAGYAVLMSNPRGSAGYGQAHARALMGHVGTVDADDVIALVNAVGERHDIDSDKVGILGRSYGGFLASWLATHYGGCFRAGLGECGVYDWNSLMGSSDIGLQMTGIVGEDASKWGALSPIAYADQMSIPFLVMHYTSDLRVPVEQGHRYFCALYTAGAQSELVEFDGGPHRFAEIGPPQDRVARLEIILAWFARWLWGDCGAHK